MFDKSRLLDIIKNFICFSGEAKILGAYHQYFAVRKAVASTANATVTNGKGGVFWHTQGSGKSLSMVFYAHLLQEALNSPTIVVLTDRNDLDDQLFGQFIKCSHFLRQVPQQAESRANLKELLAGREANGIVFTTAQNAEDYAIERAVKDFYRNEELVAMTHELTDMLRKNRTIDWQKKESARAGMRRMVKKLLKEYNYPPEGLEDAIATVIGQCEMWVDSSC